MMIPVQEIKMALVENYKDGVAELKGFRETEKEYPETSVGAGECLSSAGGVIKPLPHQTMDQLREQCYSTVYREHS